MNTSCSTTGTKHWNEIVKINFSGCRSNDEWRFVEQGYANDCSNHATNQRHDRAWSPPILSLFRKLLRKKITKKTPWLFSLWYVKTYKERSPAFLPSTSPIIKHICLTWILPLKTLNKGKTRHKHNNLYHFTLALNRTFITIDYLQKK